MDIERIEDSYREIKARAKEVIDTATPYAVRNSGVYDPSKNKIIVAGITLDGIMDAKLSAELLTNHQSGIDHRYIAIYKSIEQKTLTVDLLPTASCLPLLHQLGDIQQKSSGWFNISIHENGLLVDVYRAWINQLPEVSFKAETDNKQVVFGVRSMVDSVAKVDTPTTFETATRKGAGRPSWADKNRETADITVDENTGSVTQVETINGVKVSNTSGTNDEFIQTPKK